jgi:sulfate transport system permease protein
MSRPTTGDERPGAGGIGGLLRRWINAPGFHRPALRSLALGYLIVLVVVPTGGLAWSAFADGPAAFFRYVTHPEALAALELTLGLSLATALLSAALGTIAAFALTRFRIPGRSFLDAVVDVPFVVPTAVGGLMVFALYAPTGPLAGATEALGLEVLYAKPGILLALLLVCFPFTIRAVQPLLEGLDVAVEEAAATLGATRWQAFRWIVWPAIAPGVATGTLLSFARALGEFGTVVVVSGNLPYKTKLAAVYIYGEVESGRAVSAAAVSLLLVLLSAGLLFLSEWVLHRRRRRTVAPVVETGRVGGAAGEANP